MTSRSENQIWVLAFAASIAFHALLLFLSPAFPKKEPMQIMNVRLTTAKVGLGAASGGGTPKANADSKTAASPKKQKSAVVTQKTVKPIKSTEVSQKPSGENITASENGVSGGAGESLQPGDGGSGGGTGGGVGPGHGIGGTAGLVDVGTLRIISKVIPDYPAFSRKRREEGTLTIVITIENGLVSQAEIERSCGYERLDASAMRAVKKWRFDHSGAIRARVPITFRLEK